jgi:hypothetical protein
MTEFEIRAGDVSFFHRSEVDHTPDELIQRMHGPGEGWILVHKHGEEIYLRWELVEWVKLTNQNVAF